MTASWPRQGDVWDIDFEPVRGHEQGGIRPALIVSKDGFNASPSGLCVVVPITSRQRGWLSHIDIAPPEGGLTGPSAALCDQIRTVSRVRLIRRRGPVTAKTLSAVLQLIHRIVG